MELTLTKHARRLLACALSCSLAACGGGGTHSAPSAPAISIPVPVDAAPSDPTSAGPTPSGPIPPEPAAAAPATQAFALMDAGDGATEFNKFLSMSRVDGIAVRTSWRALEPVRGSYDWTAVDLAVAAAANHGKKLGLHVLASGYAPAPDWLAANGMQSYSYRAPNGAAVTDPLPWDGVFLGHWSAFVAGMASHLRATGGLARVQYLSVAAPVPEMSLVGCANGLMGTSTVSYDRQKYLGAWETAVRAVQSAFPATQKLLPVPVATICRPDTDGPAFYLQVFGGAVGIEADGFSFYATDLNAHGSSRMDGIFADKNRAPVVLQFVGSASDDPARRMEGTLKAAICAGLGTYGASLMELYKADLSSTDPAIQDAVAAIRSPRDCE